MVLRHKEFKYFKGIPDLLIWSGWGLVTGAILGIGILFGIKVLGPEIGLEYGGALGLTLAAAVNFPIGRFLNNPNKDRIVVDEVTGERLALKKRSTLFFIPMQWWSVIALILVVINVLNLADK